MGALGDTCEFCGAYCDPIGADTARFGADGLLWCGQCDQGLVVRLGHLDDAALERLAVEASEYLAASPLWPQFRDPQAPVDDLRTHLAKLDLMDTAAHARRLLELRAQRRRIGVSPPGLQGGDHESETET